MFAINIYSSDRKIKNVELKIGVDSLECVFTINK